MSEDSTGSQQYHHMNAGAHRRPPPQISAPALIWHRGFWMPEEEAQRRAKGPTEGSPWKECVDNALAHLLRALIRDTPAGDCTSPNYERDDDVLYLFNHKVTGLTEPTFELETIAPDEKSVRHVVFTARIRYAGLWLTVGARLHHENFVILFALDFSGDVDETSVEGPALKEMADEFHALHELIVNRYDRDRKAEKQSGSREILFDATYDVDRPTAENLSKELIARFRGFVDRVCDGALHRPCNAKPGSLRGVGELFADFIGLVYSLHIKNDSLTYAYQPEDQGPLKMSAQVGGTDFRRKNGLNVLDAAWPIVTSADCKSDIDRAHGDPEYVVAAFNDGRTLYVSSLGRLNAAEGEFTPLIYTLIVSYPSPWRLGRFIDKLNTVGTLRLAALRDLPDINNASNEIDRVSRLLAVGNERHGREPDLEEIEKEFSRIGQAMALGLSYRIVRSRYYVNSYKDTVESLRPEHLQGYQFYLNFIRSRVFDAFYYIDRVGARYDSLKGEIEFRANFSRRKEAHNLQVATARQAHAAASLLEAAEILSVIPLTYYGGHILAELLAPLRQIAQLSWLPAEPSGYYPVALILSIVLAYGSRAFRKRRSRVRRLKPRVASKGP